jgi:hypothetical protein
MVTAAMFLPTTEHTDADTALFQQIQGLQRQIDDLKHQELEDKVSVLQSQVRQLQEKGTNNGN